MPVLYLFKCFSSDIHCDFYVAPFNIGNNLIFILRLRPWMLAQLLSKEYCQAKKVCQDGLK